MSWANTLKRDRVEHLRQLYLQFNSDTRNLHGQPYNEGESNFPDDDLPKYVLNATEENIDEVIKDIITNWRWMLNNSRKERYTTIEQAKELLKWRREVTQFIKDLRDV
tara:strand:+ start:43 stop:366 length:324 start_codon:yes stop_codon:yes gene_type:complete